MTNNKTTITTPETAINQMLDLLQSSVELCEQQLLNNGKEDNDQITS